MQLNDATNLNKFIDTQVSSFLEFIVEHMRKYTQDREGKVSSDFAEIHNDPKFYEFIEQLNSLLKKEKKTLELINETYEDTYLNTAFQKVFDVSKDSIKSFDKDANPEVFPPLINQLQILQRVIWERVRLDGPLAFKSADYRRAMRLTPEQAISKGFLFRGVSQEDYNMLIHGHTVFAHENPNMTVYSHILQRQNKRDDAGSRFFSFTCDAKIAARFGKVIVVKFNELGGQIIDSQTILRECNDPAARDFVLSNKEYLLKPNKTHKIASIPFESLVA